MNSYLSCRLASPQPSSSLLRARVSEPLPALSQPFRTFAVDTDAVSLLHDQPSIGRDSEVSVSLKLLSTPQIVGVSLVSLAIGLGISLLAWWVCWQRCGRQKSGESEPLKPRLPT